MRLVGFGLAWLLLRCAPLMTMQPPMGVGADKELGVGAGVSQAVIGSCVGCVTGGRADNTGFTGQLWYRHRISSGYRLGAVISGGNVYTIAGGMRLEYDLYSSEDLQVSTNIELGLFWGAVGIPLAYQAGKNGLSIYGGPFAGVVADPNQGARPVLRLPIGFAFPLGDRAMFVGEASAVYRPNGFWQSASGHVLLVVGGVGVVVTL